MANPILTDKAFEKATTEASGAGYALPPPTPGTQAGITDGPISPYRAYQPMTLDGTIARSGLLFVLLLISARSGAGTWSTSRPARSPASPAGA